MFTMFSFSREIVLSIEYTINIVSAVTSKFDGKMTIIMCWHIHQC